MTRTGGKKAEGREDELRVAIRRLLEEKKSPMTRKELWEGLPDELRVNEVRFKEVLEDGVNADWDLDGKEERGGYLYDSRTEERELEIDF